MPPSRSTSLVTRVVSKSARRRVCVNAILLVSSISFVLNSLYFSNFLPSSDPDTSLPVKLIRKETWATQLRFPPDEYASCEAWLMEADSVKNARDFSVQPVTVLSKENETLHSCEGIPCFFRKQLTDVKCDASIGDKSRQCKYTVVSDEGFKQAPRPNIITIGTRFDSNIRIGQPSWNSLHQFFGSMDSNVKRLPVAALMNYDCDKLTTRTDLISNIEKLGLKVQKFGKCFGDDLTNKMIQSTISKYYFTLVFEDRVKEDYLSPDYWSSLFSASIPVVITSKSIDIFSPSESAVVQIKNIDQITKVVEWVKYSIKNPDAYGSMEAWKKDIPSDIFLSLMDDSVVHEKCKICLNLATMIKHEEELRVKRPCRCKEWNKSQVEIVYHIFIRERGRLHFESIFLRSNEISVTTLLKKIHTIFKREQTIWSNSRPFTWRKSMLRIFRIYPIEASGGAILRGTAHIQTDEQLISWVQKQPCPRLEVIFV